MPWLDRFQESASGRSARAWLEWLGGRRPQLGELVASVLEGDTEVRLAQTVLRLQREDRWLRLAPFDAEGWQGIAVRSDGVRFAAPAESGAVWRMRHGLRQVVFDGQTGPWDWLVREIEWVHYGRRASALPRHDELEAELDARPDDAELQLVYADHLAGHGDPRGEILLLRAQGRDALAKEMARGLSPEDLVSPALAGRLAQLHLVWVDGFVREARAFLNNRGVIAALLEEPAARFLRALTVPSLAELGPLLASVPPGLRSLCLEARSESAPVPVDLAPALRSASHLDTLIIRGPLAGPLEHEGLRSLRVDHRWLDGPPLSLAGFPSLEELDLRAWGWARRRVALPEPYLLDAIERVRRLRLDSLDAVDLIGAAPLSSLQRLESLHCAGTVGPSLRSALLRRAPDLRQLKALHLRCHDKAERRVLRKALGGVLRFE